MQIQLTGFLDKDTAGFCKELWGLCLSAQESPQGVPKELLEAKKAELLQEKVQLLAQQLIGILTTSRSKPKKPKELLAKLVVEGRKRCTETVSVEWTILLSGPASRATGVAVVKGEKEEVEGIEGIEGTVGIEETPGEDGVTRTAEALEVPEGVVDDPPGRGHPLLGAETQETEVHTAVRLDEQ